MTKADHCSLITHRRMINAPSTRPAASSTATCGSANHRSSSSTFQRSPTLPLFPEGCQGDRGINGPALSARFMPRKPLDSLEGTDAPGSCRGWVYHRRRLPHGECGVWGRAPEDESYDTFNSADFGHNYDKIPTNSADEPLKESLINEQDSRSSPE